MGVENGVYLEEGGYQEQFLSCRKRFPALISAVGTGKTFIALMKVHNYCESYAGSIWLVGRKEFTDLRDSTMKDFARYFGVDPDSDKEVKYKNKSVIMFRHADEMGVLKNINLSGFCLEQAEEFETMDQFTFLRDRLRNESGPYRQGLIIANACGHNWIHRLWIKDSVCHEVDQATGFNIYEREEYWAATANTFANMRNLPADFVADMRRMEQDEPNHFKQYILNSFEEVERDDALLTFQDIHDSPVLEMPKLPGQRRIMAVDVARMGGDEIVWTILETRGPVRAEEIFKECKKNLKLDETTGHTMALANEFQIQSIVVDDTGVGGGVTDNLKGFHVIPFNGGEKSTNETCSNRRSEAHFKLQKYLKAKWLKLLPDEKTLDQLSSLRFRYKNETVRAILSKDEMRKEGLKSPDRSDSLIMALFHLDEAQDFTGPEYGNMDMRVDTRPRYGVGMGG